MKKLRRSFLKSRKTTTAQNRRRLLGESLESRQLLASDVGVPVANPMHNGWIPADTNADMVVTPTDALAVLNRLNAANALGEAASGVESGMFLDVNNDGNITSLDALGVINKLNLQAEGEGELLGLKLGVSTRDQDGNRVDALGGDREFTIGVNQKFELEVLFSDNMRSAADRTGAFTIYADIIASNSSAFRPVLSETQVISVSANIADGNGQSNLVLRQAGSSVTSDILLDDFFFDAERLIKTALENDFGYGAGNITVFQGTREPGDDFTYFIRFNGDAEEFVNVPQVTLDTSGITGATVTSNTNEIPVFINNDEAQGINPNAFRFNLDFASGDTARDLLIYTNVPSGTFDPGGAEIFNEVGGTGPIDSGGIRNFINSNGGLAPDGGSYRGNDLEAFSIELQAISPATDLQFTLDFADDSGSELSLYGRDDALTPALVLLDTTPVTGTGIVIANFVQGISAPNATISTNEDSAAPAFDATSGAVDNTGGTLSVVGVSAIPASVGTLQRDGNVLTFTPAADYFNTSATAPTVVATLESSNGDQAPRTISLLVNSVNDPPVAGADGPTTPALAVDELAQLTINVSDLLSNDTGGPANEGQTPTFVSVDTTSTNGGAIENNFATDGTLVFTAPSGVAQDTFNYTITDGSVQSEGTVTVTINNVPGAPIAINDTISANEDTTATLPLSDILGNDQDNDPGAVITIQSVNTDTAGASVAINGTDFVYTPPANVFGTGADTFTYTIVDNEDSTLTSTATVTVNISGVDDPPTAVNDSLPVDLGSTGTSLAVLANDSAGPGEDVVDSISVTAVGTTTAGGTVAPGSGGQSVTYTPPSSTFIGEDTFTYTIADQGGATSTATVTVNVAPRVRPLALDDTVTTNEDTSTTFNILTNDFANEGETVQLVSFSATGINATTQGSLTDNGSGSFTFTPVPDYFTTSPLTFTYQITDSGGVVTDPDAATGTVTINVTSVNDPPTFSPDGAITATEDTPININGNVTSNDNAGPANENQTVVISAVPDFSTQRGSLALSNGVVTYTPATDFNGTDSFTYTISDGDDSVTATATVNVGAVNDNPTVNDLVITDASEDDPYVIANLLAGATGGPADEPQAVTITSGTFATTSNGSVTINPDGSATYTPVADFFGEDSFTFTVTDSENASANGTVNITVIPDNPVPVANPDSISAFSGVPLTINVSDLIANDTDNNPISFVSANATGAGDVVDNLDGTITYTAPAGGTTDSFEYTITDGTSNSTGTVNVTIAQFQPSTIAGSVFIDQVSGGGRNGVKDGDETGLGAVVVVLESPGSQPLRLLTDASGNYRFENVIPGEYTLRFELPGGLVDNASDANSRTISIGPAGGVTSTDNSFTLDGFEPQAGSMLDRFSSSYYLANPASGPATGNEGIVANIGADGGLVFVDVRSGFGDIAFAEVALNSNRDQAILTIVDSSGNVRTAQIPDSRLLIVNNIDGSSIVRIFGSVDDFTFTAVNPSGAGESGSASSDFTSYMNAVDQILSQM